MHVAGIWQQHKGQADSPAPIDSTPAVLSAGVNQPAIRINRVEFDDAHSKWLNKKG